MPVDDIAAGLDLLNRLWPSPKSLSTIYELNPRVGLGLIERIGSAPQYSFDQTKQKHFLASVYNKRQQLYRSPWSNEYFEASQKTPPEGEPNGVCSEPSEQLRNIEIQCNVAYEAYRQFLFGGGVSSVYFLPLENAAGFSAAFLLRHEFEFEDESAQWVSIHVADVLQKSLEVQYRLRSSALINISTVEPDGTTNFGVTMYRKSEQSKKMQDIHEGESKRGALSPHLLVLGPMIEEVDRGVRTNVENIFLPKISQISRGLRTSNPPHSAQAKSVVAELLSRSEAKLVEI